MSAVRRISERHALLDLVALDRDDKPVLMVGIGVREPNPIVLIANLETLGAIRRDIPFAILADPAKLAIYRKDGTRSIEPIAEIPTPPILDFYGSGPEDRPMVTDYLLGMIDAWLLDFMGHWKSPTPPGSETMAALGLTTRLEGGRLKRRVRLACLPVRRDRLPLILRDGEEYWDEYDRQRAARLPPADPA